MNAKEAAQAILQSEALIDVWDAIRYLKETGESGVDFESPGWEEKLYEWSADKK